MTILKLKQELIDLIKERDTKSITLFNEKHPNFRDSNGNNILHILILYAPTAIVENFITKNLSLLNEKNKQQYTAVDLVMRLRRLDIIDIIQNLGQEVQSLTSSAGDPSNLLLLKVYHSSSLSTFWKIFNAVINGNLDRALKIHLSTEFIRALSKSVMDGLIHSLYNINVGKRFCIIDNDDKSYSIGRQLLILYFLTIVGSKELIDEFLSEERIFNSEIARLIVSTIWGSNPIDTGLLQTALNIAARNSLKMLEDDLVEDHRGDGKSWRFLTLYQFCNSFTLIQLDEGVIPDLERIPTYEMTEILIALSEKWDKLSHEWDKLSRDLGKSYQKNMFFALIRFVRKLAMVIDDAKTMGLLHTSKLLYENVRGIEKERANIIHYGASRWEEHFPSHRYIRGFLEYMLHNPAQFQDPKTFLNEQFTEYFRNYRGPGARLSPSGANLDVYKLFLHFYDARELGNKFLTYQLPPYSLYSELDINHFTDLLLYHELNLSSYYYYYLHQIANLEAENSRFSIQSFANKKALLVSILKALIINYKINKELPFTAAEERFYNSYNYQEAQNFVQHRLNQETLTIYRIYLKQLKKKTEHGQLIFKAEQTFKGSPLFNKKLIAALEKTLHKITKILPTDNIRLIATYLTHQDWEALIAISYNEFPQLQNSAKQFLETPPPYSRFFEWIGINNKKTDGQYKFDHRDDLWYTAEQIHTLLSSQFLGDDRVFIPSHNQQGHTLSANLDIAISYAAEGRIVALPIVVNNNHWVSLIIRQLAPGQYEGIFVDSLGYQASDYDLNFYRLHPQLTADNFRIVEANIQQQTNGDDCGVWTVNNIIRIISHHLAAGNNLAAITQDNVHEIINTNPDDAVALRAAQGLTLESSNTQPVLEGATQVPTQYPEISSPHDEGFTDYLIGVLGVLWVVGDALGLCPTKLHLD